MDQAMTWKDRVAKTQAFHESMAQHGFCLRTPKTRWQDYLSLSWREHRWARRMLGGKWEVYVHDLGTTHYVLSYFWVEKFHYEIKNMIGREEYRE